MLDVLLKNGDDLLVDMVLLDLLGDQFGPVITSVTLVIIEPFTIEPLDILSILDCEH
jgi:hypothetical protein